MAEEKKKIDLKSRLPRRSMGTPSGNAPPPSAPGGIPAPVLPASPTSGGIPAPPFAPSTGPVMGASVDPGNPFGAVRAQESRRAPQEIRVDVGVEAVEAARASRKLLAMAGAGGAVVGLILGWVGGAGSTNAGREKQAIEGAGLLAADVEKANGEIKSLNDKIGAALTDLKAKKFPEGFAGELAKINVPFDGSQLVGRSVGAYDQKTLNLLFQYVADVQALNTRKDALRALFAGQKDAIKATLNAGENPTMGFALVMLRDAKGPIATVAPLAEPFAMKSDWPKQLTIVNTGNRGERQQATRYESGDPVSAAGKIVAVPLEPTSVAAAFPSDISARVLSELSRTAQVLQGVQGGADEESKPGLLKNGAALADALKKINATH
jgi:hypothetical protein